MLFISPQKLFSLLVYSNFFPDFFGPVGKKLDKKVKMNDVTNWETNNTYIAQISKSKCNRQ